MFPGVTNKNSNAIITVVEEVAWAMFVGMATSTVQTLHLRD